MSRGRHAAPAGRPLARVRTARGASWSPAPQPAGRGRHRAPSRGVGSPAAVVLLGVSAGSLGLVGVLPSSGEAVPRPALAAASAPVAPVAPDRTAAQLSAERRLAAARASRARSTAPRPAPTPVDLLPGCTVPASAAQGYANGRIPRSALCTLPGHAGHALRADAARAFVALDAAYRARFGERLCVTDSYRSYGAQVALARSKPRLAARPGTSEHGEGVAVDLACGVDGYRTPQHRWMVANAARFGWEQPAWAQDGGRREEPWHWELRE